MKIKSYENPYWSNKQGKHIIATLVFEDGRKQTASIQGEDNPDFLAIMEEFGEEVLDKNTEEGIKRRDENLKRRAERNEASKMRAQQEQLFNVKLEAFNIEAIKGSKHKDIKRLIRKAKSPMEVQAYTSVLLMKELEDPSNVGEEQTAS